MALLGGNDGVEGLQCLGVTFPALPSRVIRGEADLPLDGASGLHDFPFAAQRALEAIEVFGSGRPLNRRRERPRAAVVSLTIEHGM